ncbi:MAG: hypothetical protein H0S85_02410 [Desulfovibrionaceae bacterium]|jgi:hypothetical protein|nr:hypothetical protein [Desulfovibrionaceae bacterium]
MKYLSIKKGNFVCFGDEIGSELNAKITLAGKRFLLWGPHGLEAEQVCQDESQMQFGWVLAYDLDLIVGQESYRLTIYDSFVSRDFKPYLAELASRNLRLSDVVTHIAIVSHPGSMPTLQFRSA